MMKAGFYSTFLHKLPLAEMAGTLAAAGYETVELNGDQWSNGFTPHVTPSLDTKGRQAVVDAIGDAGMAISAISACLHLAKGSAAERRAGIGYLKASVDLARDIGAPMVWVFTGRAFDGLELAAARRHLAAALEEVCDHARSRGVVFGIEGCSMHIVCRIEEYLELFRAIPGADLKVAFDPTHFQLRGEDPVRAAEVLFDRIGNYHVKDSVGRFPDFKCVPLGAGEVDLKSVTETLRRLGYAGTASVEYESHLFGWEPPVDQVIRESRAFLRDLGI